MLISARDKPIFKFRVQQEALISFQRQWEEILGPQNQQGVRSQDRKQNTQQTTTWRAVYTTVADISNIVTIFDTRLLYGYPYEILIA